MKLSATQQALLQFLESIAITAFLAALISIGPLLTGAGPLDWRLVGTTFGLAFVYSLGHSIAAYLKAADPNSPTGASEAQLGALIDSIIAALEKRYSTQPLPPVIKAPENAIALPASNISYPATIQTGARIVDPSTPLQGDTEGTDKLPVVRAPEGGQ